jgi:ABC-2 type transport system permease protein
VLWYKAWRETNSRFLIFLCAMVGLPSLYIYNEAQGVERFAQADWYYRALHTGHAFIATMWAVGVMLLMMGGLLRERAIGAASFTLALPVSRTRLMKVRILFGLLQAMILIVVPWGAMFLVSKTFGLPTAIAQAGFHGILLAGGGIVFFAVALLVSSLIEGEYTAPAVSFGILFVDVIASDNRLYRGYSPWNLMLGTAYFDRKSGLLVGSVPWSHMLANILLATLLTAISIRAIQRKDF